MKLQGKLKVVLKDAETDEIVYEREKHNTVTGAAYNVINGAVARARKANYSQLQLGSNSEDIIRMLFGGMMVFSERPDSDMVVPNAELMTKSLGNGNQGSPISGSVMKGTLTSATVTADSAEFQWDFSANQCNGRISAICLTSNKGGELGCRIMARDSSKNSESFIYGYSDKLCSDVDTDFSASYPRTNFLNLTGGTGNTGLKLIDGDKLVAYQGTTRYTWDLEKYRNTFDFTDTQYILPEIQATTETVDTPIPGYVGNDDGNLIHGPMTDYALKGKCVCTENNNNYTYTLQLTKCTRTSQSTINVPMNNIITDIKLRYADLGCDVPDDGIDTYQNINNNIEYNCFTWDNKLYWFVGSLNNSDTDFIAIYIQEYDGSFTVIDNLQQSGTDFDTAFLNLIDSSNISGYKGVLYGDSIFGMNTWFDIAVLDHEEEITETIGGETVTRTILVGAPYMRVNDYWFLIDISSAQGVRSKVQNRPSFYIPNATLCFSRLTIDSLAPLPYYRTLGNAVGESNAYDMNWCVASVLRTNYLATIWTDSTPATKTPSHVMTVTYRLTRTNS